MADASRAWGFRASDFGILDVDLHSPVLRRDTLHMWGLRPTPPLLAIAVNQTRARVLAVLVFTGTARAMRFPGLGS